MPPALTAHFEAKTPAGARSGDVYLIMDSVQMGGATAEVLAASGLEHACLLQGQSAQDQEASAPWIVRLETPNRFTQNVFTYTPDRPAPWHYWRHGPGLLIQSAASLDELRSHFRKFLRIRDEAGKAFYLRFWECGPMLDYIRRSSDPKQLAAMWLRTVTGEAVDLVLPISGYCYHCYARGDVAPTQASRGSFTLSKDDRAALYDGTLRAKASRILYHMECYNTDVFKGRDREALILQAVATIKRLIKYRVTGGRDVARAVRLEVLLRSPLEAWDKSGYLSEVLGSDLRESRKLDLVEAHVDAAFAEPVGL